jgi:hypothetical protein
MKSKSFDLKHFSLDSRYTNLPEEPIHRKYVWIAKLDVAAMV